MQFLMGLNDSFAAIRGTILMMNPLPDTRKTHAFVLQQERQADVAVKKEAVMANFQKTAIPSNRAPETRQRPKCSHCGRVGHSIERCFFLHGFPPDSGSSGKSAPNKDKKAMTH